MDDDRMLADTPRAPADLRPLHERMRLPKEEKDAMEQILGGVLAKEEGSWGLKK